MSDDPKQQRVEESIKEEVVRTLSERASRRLQVDNLGLVPLGGPFAAPSAECVDLFQDGHYYGCIALVQSVTEAILRYVWQTKHHKDKQKAGNFEKNLSELSRRGFISDDTKAKIDAIWRDRNDYHHLSPSLDRKVIDLEVVAREKIQLLADVEREFFDHSFRNGMIVPKHPEYWPQTDDGAVTVYVRRTP